jgi:Ca2+/H+ antiporter
VYSLTLAGGGAAVCRYLLYLFFELHTHNFLFTSSSELEGGDHSTPRLSSAGAVFLLALITAGVAVASEYVAHLLLFPLCLIAMP